ncbi:MAG: phosphatase PAP2 family protein [Candidatus Paceibacteria bacterium]
MDSLSSTIVQLDFWWLTPVAVLLDNELLLIVTTFTLVLLAERRRQKLLKIALAVGLAVLLSAIIKDLVKIERPCVDAPGKIECPPTYSFPSGHTIVAFTVMIAFLNKPTFVLYFVYATLVAFTRIYLGVHSFEDVAGSIALAPFVYYITDEIWKKIKGEKYAFRTISKK